jgi:diguanylate cyclase (GGDEF)-like protein
LAIIDLDYFKSLNDRYGHPIGDRALQTLARVLTDAVRRSDIVTRPGGDEFVVVLPDTPVSGAARIVARIRKRLSEMRLEVGAGIEPIQLAISCGIADLEAAGGDCEQLVRLADEALYEAKRAGRNQTARAGG